MPADELRDSYRPSGHTSPGGQLRLRHDEALRFIADCERLGFVILGADFVTRDETGTLPVADTPTVAEAAIRLNPCSATNGR